MNELVETYIERMIVVEGWAEAAEDWFQDENWLIFIFSIRGYL